MFQNQICHFRNKLAFNRSEFLQNNYFLRELLPIYTRFFFFFIFASVLYMKKGTRKVNNICFFDNCYYMVNRKSNKSFFSISSVYEKWNNDGLQYFFSITSIFFFVRATCLSYFLFCIYSIYEKWNNEGQ